MQRFLLIALIMIAVLPSGSDAQQTFRLPDVNALKHLTTKMSDHAADIPGDETTINYYSAPNGEIISIYSFRGRNVAFSAHSNSDVQGTYKFFMDVKGEGLFQQMNAPADWQLPAWVRR
jgi:hypothetical protein